MDMHFFICAKHKQTYSTEIPQNIDQIMISVSKGIYNWCGGFVLHVSLITDWRSLRSSGHH